ncbi:hypothetical protein ABFS83_04G135600 [Erythranthe nasuta]
MILVVLSRKLDLTRISIHIIEQTSALAKFRSSKMLSYVLTSISLETKKNRKKNNARAFECFLYFISLFFLLIEVTAITFVLLLIVCVLHIFHLCLELMEVMFFYVMDYVLLVEVQALL